MVKYVIKRILLGILIMLDDAGCAPVAYYNDFWLQKTNLKNTWHSPYGYWYFMYGSIEK